MRTGTAKWAQFRMHASLGAACCDTRLLQRCTLSAPSLHHETQSAVHVASFAGWLLASMTGFDLLSPEVLCVLERTCFMRRRSKARPRPRPRSAGATATSWTVATSSPSPFALAYPISRSGSRLFRRCAAHVVGSSVIVQPWSVSAGQSPATDYAGSTTAKHSRSAPGSNVLWAEGC